MKSAFSYLPSGLTLSFAAFSVGVGVSSDPLLCFTGLSSIGVTETHLPNCSDGRAVRPVVRSVLLKVLWGVQL